MDFTDYQPSPDVLKHLRDVDFVAVVGPTAVGKTTLINAAIAAQPKLHLVVVTTSRAPRPGEQDGVDYRFRSKKEIGQRIDKAQFVQIAPNVLGDIYATVPEAYPRRGAAIMAVLADALATFRSLPFKSFRAIFIVPPSWQEWQKRLQTHSFTPEQLAKRLDEARRSFAFALQDASMQFVINDDKATAAEDFLTLATNQSASERLMHDQKRARDIVAELVEKL